MSKLTLSFKGRILKVFPVLKGSMLIGSDPSCTIHIDSLALQPQHARIDTVDQTSKLIDLGTEEGIYVNQQRVSEHTLKNDDLIRAGKHTLIFTYEEVPDMEDVSATPAEVAEESEGDSSLTMEMELRSGFLQIMSGANMGKTMSLNRAMTNLGKPGVATAVIAKRVEGYYLSHLEGKQPPTINNKPIGEKAEKLDNGDVIQIGNIRMEFYLE